MKPILILTDNNTINILSVIAPFFIILLIIVLPVIIIANRLEKKRKNKFPNQLPFTYGYYCGIMSIFVGIMCLIFALYKIIIDEVGISELVLTLFIGCVLYSVAGFFVIKRKKNAWLFLTLISVNIFIWIINYYYGKKRWNELEL